MEGLPSIYKGVRANAHRAGAHSALTPLGLRAEWAPAPDSGLSGPLPILPPPLRSMIRRGGDIKGIGPVLRGGGMGAHEDNPQPFRVTLKPFINGRVTLHL